MFLVAIPAKDRVVARIAQQVIAVIAADHRVVAVEDIGREERPVGIQQIVEPQVQPANGDVGRVAALEIDRDPVDRGTVDPVEVVGAVVLEALTFIERAPLPVRERRREVELVVGIRALRCGARIEKLRPPAFA